MDLKAEIQKWVLEKLSGDQEFLSGMPACPYAQEAILKNKVQIESIDSSNWKEVVGRAMQLFSDDEYEMLVLGIESWEGISPEEVLSFSQELRDKHFEEDKWILIDHPKLDETVSNFSFNHGFILLFMVQRLSRLVEASRALETKGYYKDWPEDYYNIVVGTRNRYYDKMLLQKRKAGAEA